MGPSGSGKTTFMDILTGRRKSDNSIGSVFVNGLPLEENRNWYLSNTGYVLQLAAPYYEELTVRENLTLAAWVKLHISSREKFQRVEQVMEVSGLMDLADTVVGGATGPGLSGGQKRRLTVALQLLKLPSVIFLDEPTSGLDSASSIDILTHLNALAASNRTVVLTIHQPRLEIFHMFHRIIVLSEGQVVYHGVPDKTYEVFVNALQSAFLTQGIDIPPLEDHNPADVIMDMLGNHKMRNIINNYYGSSGELELVRKAVSEAWTKEQQLHNDDNCNYFQAKINHWRTIFQGTRYAGRTQNYSIERLATLEARAMKTATLGATFFLPFIFFIYSIVLGTIYYQKSEPYLLHASFSVYSLANCLFIFDAIYYLYSRAQIIYTFEHADGAGRATDLVIQPFVRFITLSFFPVFISTGMLYALVLEKSRWDGVQFLEIALINIALNQTWVAIVIWFFVMLTYKFRSFSAVIAAVTGFFAGFLIPITDIPLWWRWLVFINPNFYGLSASTVVLLTDFESDCERDGGSELECYVSSGEFILASFDIININPYLNIVILLSMTVFCLLMASLTHWLRYLHLNSVIKQLKSILLRLYSKSNDTVPQLSEEKPQEENNEQETRTSVSLDDGEIHTVWKPNHRPSLRSVDISERRKRLQNRVWATQQVLKVQTNDETNRRHTDPKKWHKALNHAKALNKKSSEIALSFHDSVSQYYAVTTTSKSDNPQSQPIAGTTRVIFDACSRAWKSQFMDDITNRLQSPTTSSSVPLQSTFSIVPEEIEPTQEDSSV